MRGKLYLVLLVGICLAVPILWSCSGDSGNEDALKYYPVDSLDGIIMGSGIVLDKEISSDKKGSVRIDAEIPTVANLYETGDIDIEDARLIYQADVRTKGVEGKVYLEMWCIFKGQGQFFSRGLNATLSGDNEWTTTEIPFFLKKGQNPDNVKLNIVIDGTGTVWVDNIRLLKRPLTVN